MITVAKVIEANGNIATVEAERKSACSGCHKQSNGDSCSACALLGGNSKIRTTARNTVGAKVGDRVEIESSSPKMILYAFLIFILPIAVAAVAYVIASSLTQSEGVRLLFVAIGFFAVMVINIIISKAVSKKDCDVNIVKIIKENIE